MSDIPSIDIDFGNVKPFEALPGGDYKAIVSDAVVTATKGTKDLLNDDPDKRWNMVLTLEVEEPAEYSGKSTKAWVYIDPTNPFGLLAVVEAVLDMELGESQINLPQLVQEVQGKSVGITMEEGEYQGKPSSNVVAWFPA